jgi:hypothetical protein
MGVHRFSGKAFPVLFAVALLLSSSLLAFGDDQKKAEKQTARITAMAAADPLARAIESATMADFFGVPRIQLVRERRAMNLNYGSLFVAHQIVAAGAKMIDVAVGLHSGKSIFQIADERKLDWRAVTDSAKKLNGKVEENVYKHFLHAEADLQRAVEEKYDPDKDAVKADENVTYAEVEESRQNYVFWRDRAGQISAKRLDPNSETVIGKSADVYKGFERPHD